MRSVILFLFYYICLLCHNASASSHGNSKPALTPRDQGWTNANIFVKNESRLFLLAHDDVVLGEVTEKARIKYMDFDEFANLIKNEIKDNKYIKNFVSMESFLANYDDNFKMDSHMRIYDVSQFVSSDDKNQFDPKHEAFIAVTRGNDEQLKAILDNYPAIIKETDGDGNTLLHVSSFKGDYHISKLLLIKGINPLMRNNHGHSSLKIGCIGNESGPICRLLVQYSRQYSR